MDMNSQWGEKPNANSCIQNEVRHGVAEGLASHQFVRGDRAEGETNCENCRPYRKMLWWRSLLVSLLFPFF